MHTTHTTLTPAVWSDREIVRAAGFITYAAHLAMPELAAVEAQYGHRFESAERLRSGIHATAGLMVAGMGAHPDHPAGADDPVIAARLARVGAMHRHFVMPAWGMTYIIGILVVAPAWALGQRYPQMDTPYHQAAARVAQAMGITLPPAAKLDTWLRGMIARRAGHSDYGAEALRLFASLYPDIEGVSAMPAVPEGIRTFVATSL